MSSLDLRSRLLIEPSFYYVMDENNCDRKISKMAKHLGPVKARQSFLENNRCDVVTQKVVGETEHIILNKCLCQVYDKNIYTYLEMYKAYKNGILPYKGGYYEQPAIAIEIINTIDYLISDREQEQQKKQEKRKGK